MGGAPHHIALVSFSQSGPTGFVRSFPCYRGVTRPSLVSSTRIYRTVMGRHGRSQHQRQARRNGLGAAMAAKVLQPKPAQPIIARSELEQSAFAQLELARLIPPPPPPAKYRHRNAITLSNIFFLRLRKTPSSVKYIFKKRTDTPFPRTSRPPPVGYSDTPHHRTLYLTFTASLL